MWKTLKCNTMKDYLNHYLITDILLLADVFENVLDPIHYYSLPGLSWQGVELELITDPDKHQMGERSMHGVISNISHRYTTWNHPSMDAYIVRMKNLGRWFIKMVIRYTHGQCHKCFLFEALNGYLMRLIFWTFQTNFGIYGYGFGVPQGAAW